MCRHIRIAGGALEMKVQEKHGVFVDPIEDLVAEVTGFLADPDMDDGPGCEVLVSQDIGGFHYSSNQLALSLSKLLQTAARETPDREDIILTFTVTEQQNVHLSVVSPCGGFDGLNVDAIRQLLNSHPGADGDVKETPNTAFWRGGTPDEETDLRLESVAFGGGTKATVVVPEALVDWRT